jgi:uncharacterized protein (DUF58 family)
VIPKELLAALRTIEITTARLATDQLVGSYGSVFKGQGLSFAEVRPYQPGDDVRSIDWNVSARMNEAFVKVFTEEREMTVMLVVDVSASQRFGTLSSSKARVATEVAALCAFSAIKNNDRVGLVLASDRIERLVPPRKGRKHVMRVLREILATEPERRGTDLGLALETLYGAARRRSVAFVISDWYSSGWERALASASARHDVIPVVLNDRADEALPDVGLAMFEDSESGESVLVDTSSRRVREHYSRQYWERNTARLKVFRKLGLDSVQVSTGASYVKPLRDLFAARARRIHR